MVKPGGTGRPRLAISARPTPLPPRRLRMSARPSALPLPKPKTHFDLAGALAEGFLGGAFAGAAGSRGTALPAGRLLIDLIRRDVRLTMEFTDSVAPRPNYHSPPCRRQPRKLSRNQQLARSRKRRTAYCRRNAR